MPGSLGSVRATSRRSLARPLLVKGLPPRRAALLGSIAIGVVTLMIALLGDSIGHATQALLLVLPVAATAGVGGRRAAQFAAALATLMFILVLPPVGTLRIRFPDDLVALIVFWAVGFTISGLVAHRIEVLGHRDEQRAALLRSVSHDLRTPLAAIYAVACDLQDESLYGEAERGRLLAHVAGEAERLDRLVANLLSLARIEGGGLEPKRQAVDVVELVDDSTRRLSRVLDANVVRIEGAPDLPSVLADHTLLGQVVTNLLENAARHSPPGAPIDIAVRAATGSVQIQVMDGGPGVRPEDAAAIFEPFHTGGQTAGTGVGLAICKAVVEAHGGTIVLGESPAGGAAFTVSLPIA